jgi:hypothetical protein
MEEVESETFFDSSNSNEDKNQKNYFSFTGQVHISSFNLVYVIPNLKNLNYSDAARVKNKIKINDWRLTNWINLTSHQELSVSLEIGVTP